MSDEPAESTVPDDLARSFGAVAGAYDRGRPSYPDAAVAWLAGGDAKVVLELGAGTGKLTRQLVDEGHAVFATEPDEAMLAVLRERVPEVSAKVATAENIPANDRSVDVVVVAQAFHWFDHEVALPEIARVLKPGGHLALVWNFFDQRIPWVRRLVAVVGEHSATSSSASDALDGHELFEPVERTTFAFWQDINRDTLVDIVASRSYVAALADDEREATLDAVRALYDEYGRGHDGMQLPYVTECFRAKVRDLRDETPDPEGDDAEGRPRVSDGTDTDMLLIDFR